MINRASSNVLVFSPDSDPYGISYAEWTAKWWQWVLSIPIEINPAKDNTGGNCGINQSGPVWFLAGTVGGVVKRNCSIPEGKAILLPILNHGGTLADRREREMHIKGETELLEFAGSEMDVISNLEVSVDGIKLNNLCIYRIRSPVFDVVLPRNNLFEGTPGPTRGAADGYWLFLKPPSRGKHNIKSFGSCLSGTINIGVNYDVLVI
ncbi:MAG: hypothetical protein M3297_06350 [Thermoproteota archaeon]|nr:hypothetical protein [Thermoproteota archaeon]